MSDGEQDPAQLVFPGFRFGVDDPGRALDLAAAGVGGFCLYQGSVRQVAAFTARMQARARVPLLFCADYEDGAALHCRGTTALPSNMGLGACGRPGLARLKGEVTAREALALGVRWVLAPVVDLAVEPANPIVNIRAFGADPALAVRLARAYLAGLRRLGVLGCLKHFPGHGRTVRDSHLELPLVRACRGLLERSDLVPFRELARAADAVMLGHLAVPALGSGRDPFTLSPAARRLLRGRYGFRGLVSTDALDMGAVRRGYGELDVLRRSLRAGADVLLVPRDPAALAAGLRAAADDPETGALIAAALGRLRAAKLRAGLHRGDPGPRRGLLAAVGGTVHQRAARRLAEACLAWSGGAAPPPARRLAYVELGGGPREPAGREFLAELRRLGAAVRPGAPHPGERLVLASFLRPRAYCGRIGHDQRDLAAARRLLAASPDAVLVAFGSPFVLADFPGRPGLCAFSGNAPAQRAAAGALLGRVPVRGRMPVAIPRAQ